MDTVGKLQFCSVHSWRSSPEISAYKLCSAFSINSVALDASSGSWAPKMVLKVSFWRKLQKKWLVLCEHELHSGFCEEGAAGVPPDLMSLLYRAVFDVVSIGFDFIYYFYLVLKLDTQLEVRCEHPCFRGHRCCCRTETGIFTCKKNVMLLYIQFIKLFT